MFLRLLQHRPILVPHGGLVVGTYGHVDDLCAAMIAAATTPEAAGEVFNVSTDSVDVNRYISVLAGVVGAERRRRRSCRTSMLDEIAAPGSPPAYSHLFGTRHHAALDVGKAARLLGAPRFDLRAGHEHTYAWCRERGLDQLEDALVDPVWKASWDFDFEAAIAGRIRG